MGCNPEEVRMKLSKLIILICMGVVLSAVGSYLFFRGGAGNEDNEIIQEMKQTTETADVTVEDIHYVETKGEKKAWELRAKTGQHFREADYTTLENLTVTFYAEGGRIITLKGNSGSVRGREEIEVSGDVVITSSDGYRVTTNSLHYSDEKQQISTADPVTLEGKGVQVKGVGAVVDLKTKKVSILRKVQTVIK
jgi:LPS export ABC transporter protein LptC